MKKINDEWLDNHIIELKNIYEILKDDSIEFIKQDKIWSKRMKIELGIKENESLIIPASELGRVKFDNSHLHFKEEMKKYDVDMIRVIQSLFWIGREVNGKRPRKNGYKVINTYLYNESKDSIIEYLTGKRSDVLFRDIERGLMLSGMLDKVKGAIAYEKVSGRNN